MIYELPFESKIVENCGSVHLNTLLNRIERPEYPYASA